MSVCSTCQVHQAPLKSAKARIRLAAPCTLKIGCENILLFAAEHEKPHQTEGQKCHLNSPDKSPEYEEIPMLKIKHVNFVHCIPTILDLVS